VNLNSEQVQKIADMLGQPSVRWSKNGAMFCSQQTPEMDALVSEGAMRVEKTVEPWGEMFTYIVTDEMRRHMARMMLNSNVEDQRLEGI
jgi:hypothetical protein